MTKTYDIGAVQNAAGVARIAAAAFVVFAVSACSSPIQTKLPDSTQSLKPALTPKQGKEAVQDLLAEQAARRAEAEKALQDRK